MEEAGDEVSEGDVEEVCEARDGCESGVYYGCLSEGLMVCPVMLGFGTAGLAKLITCGVSNVRSWPGELNMEDLSLERYRCRWETLPGKNSPSSPEHYLSDHPFSVEKGSEGMGRGRVKGLE